MDTARVTRARPPRPGEALWARVQAVWTSPHRGWRPSVRDACIAAVLTIVAVVAAYGEAHPQNARLYFTGSHHLPHTPDAALLLVAAAGIALAWRHLYPRTVLCLSTAAGRGSRVLCPCNAA